MKTLTTLAISAALVATSSAATTIPETETFSGAGTTTLNFEQFDTLGGTRTLTAIEWDITYTKSEVSITYDNDGAGSFSGAVSQEVVFDMSSTDVSLTNTSFGQIAQAITSTTSDTLTYAAQDTDSTFVFNDDGGPDNDTVVFVGDSKSELDQFVTVGAWASGNTGYLGSGNFDISGLTAIATAAEVTGDNVRFSGVTTSVEGTVTLTYHYTVVPEPSSTALLGLGGLALIMRRRRA